METERFDAIVKSVGASRRALLAGAMAGLLAATPLGLDVEPAAARRRKRRRRNRRETWQLSANHMSYLDEHPASSGDRDAYNSKANIQITRRRRRYQICGSFQYYTDASSASRINVRDVIIQPGNTSHSTPAVVTFPGWTASNTNDAGCQTIAGDLARQIVASPGDYHVNIRTNHPDHRNGAVAAPLTLH